MTDTIPTPFAPPALESIVHEAASPQLPAEIGGTALAGASENGEEKETTFEGRLAELQEKIAELPDTTSREIQVDTDNDPERVVSLEQMANFCKGWKLHLNFDTQNPTVVSKITEVLDKLRQGSAVTNFKIGQSGGSDNPGKEATVYVGSRDKSNLLADFISKELGDLLKDPDGATLTDDILLAKGVMGRFEVDNDQEFHQYGQEGFPYLKHEFGQARWLPEDQKPAYQADLAAKSRARLIEKYGDYFTGSNYVGMGK